MSPEDRAFLAKVREREQKATPGPWAWFGNTDVRHVYLATRGWGRQFIMQFSRWGMQGAQPVFCAGRTWKPDPKGMADFDYAPGATGMTPASEMPVFEVAPTATHRGDQRVYRADLSGIRHPDAEFIAHAREDVPRLLAIIDSLTGGGTS